MFLSGRGARAEGWEVGEGVAGYPDTTTRTGSPLQPSASRRPPCTPCPSQLSAPLSSETRLQWSETWQSWASGSLGARFPCKPTRPSILCGRAPCPSASRGCSSTSLSFSVGTVRWSGKSATTGGRTVCVGGGCGHNSPDRRLHTVTGDGTVHGGAFQLVRSECTTSCARVRLCVYLRVCVCGL